jgi:D-serine deaminase-like pyridoxal phosphate-dependent protein
VVASHRDGRFVLDSGSKALASDRPAWISGHGLLPSYPNAVIRGLSEHHAVVIANGPQPRVGDVVAVVPNHCCTVVNLVDELIAVRNGEIVDRWPVASRGRNN